MSWLRTLLPLPGGPRVDPLLGDAQAHQWHARLARGDWSELGSFLRAQHDVETRDFYLYVLTSEMRGWPAWLDEWVEHEPHNALPRLVRGWRFLHYGWEARGEGRAHTVKGESWPLFFDRLTSADTDLAVAADLAPQDAGPWVPMLTTCRGLQLGATDLRRRFSELERRYPWHAQGSQSMLQSLAAKWSGSHEEMFDFARTVSARAPDGSGAHVVIADAHMEFAGDDEAPDDYWSLPEVREEIIEAAHRCLDAPRVTPRTVELRGRFAFSLWLAGERVLLREQLAQMNNIITLPWSSTGNPRLAFSLAQRAANRAET